MVKLGRLIAKLPGAFESVFGLLWTFCNRGADGSRLP